MSTLNSICQIVVKEEKTNLNGSIKWLCHTNHDRCKKDPKNIVNKQPCLQTSITMWALHYPLTWPNIIFLGHKCLFTAICANFRCRYKTNSVPQEALATWGWVLLDLRRERREVYQEDSPNFERAQRQHLNALHNLFKALTVRPLPVSESWVILTKQPNKVSICWLQLTPLPRSQLGYLHSFSTFI